VQHRHPHRDQEIDDLAVTGQAGVELRRLCREDGRNAAEFVEQLVDDRTDLRDAERRQQPL
jgi:hypothetical protein